MLLRCLHKNIPTNKFIYQYERFGDEPFAQDWQDQPEQHEAGSEIPAPSAPVENTERQAGAILAGAQTALDRVSAANTQEEENPPEDIHERERLLRQRLDDAYDRAVFLNINIGQALGDLNNREAANLEEFLVLGETAYQRLQTAIRLETQAGRTVLERNRDVLGQLNLGGAEYNSESLITNRYVMRSLAAYWVVPNPREAIWSNIISAMDRAANTPNEQDNAERPRTGREHMADYLASNERLREHYEHYREDLMQALREFRVAAMGTPLAAHAARLYQDFEENFDKVCLRLFETVGLRENPELVERILRNTVAPGIAPALFPTGLLGASTMNADRPRAIMMSTFLGSESYERFRMVFLHEFSHVYIEALGGEMHGRNNVLNEGITQMLAEEVTSRHDDDIYVYGKTLASYLFVLDKDALMDWYTGGSSNVFQERLHVKLTPFYGDEEANALAARIVQSGDEAFGRKIRLAREIDDFINGTFNITSEISVTDLAYEYAFGEISLREFQTACERRTDLNFSSIEVFAGRAMDELQTTLYNNEMNLIERLKRAVGMRANA